MALRSLYCIYLLTLASVLGHEVLGGDVDLGSNVTIAVIVYGHCILVQFIILILEIL